MINIGWIKMNRKMLVDFLNYFINNVCDCTSDINLDGELDFVYSFLESQVDVDDVVDRYLDGYSYEKQMLMDFILFYKEFEGYDIKLQESEIDLIELFLGERYE
jgi:hypothetical protein